jgi:hypothetical protein
LDFVEWNEVGTRLSIYAFPEVGFWVFAFFFSLEWTGPNDFCIKNQYQHTKHQHYTLNIKHSSGIWTIFITQLISWYHRASELEADANDYADIIQNDFKAIQELANELDPLQFCFPRAGSISIIHPSNEEPNLSYLHQSITTSSNIIYAPIIFVTTQ